MINKIYFKGENTARLKGIFLANERLPSIIMPDFLEKKDYAALENAVKRCKYKIEKEPMHFRYSASETPKIFSNMINSKGTSQLISRIINKKIKKIGGKLYNFGRKDYTLLNDEKMEKPGFDIIIDFGGWDGGFGGMITYSDGMGNSDALEPRPNTLTIVKRKKGMQKFVKYVNNEAGKRKRLFFMGSIITR